MCIRFFKLNFHSSKYISFGARYAITKAFCVAFLMTFFSIFDVPVFWPILLCYWIVLLVLTMKRQIMHMIKYKYVPFNIGKQVNLIFSFKYCVQRHNIYVMLPLAVCLENDTVPVFLISCCRSTLVRNHLPAAAKEGIRVWLVFVP